MLVYDQTRQCVFHMFPGQNGYDRMFKKVKEEKATLSRKSYFNACFNTNGKCNIFPNSARLKNGELIL